MDEKMLAQRVETVFSQYKSLFGGSDHLNLSEDIAIAQKDMQMVLKMEEAAKTRCSEKDAESLGSEAKVASYDHFIQTENSRKRKQKQHLSDLLLVDAATKSDVSNRAKSKLEILAEERDYKRRRQSYKGGKAASSKRSYTEVIRDVIETQSDMLRAMQFTAHQNVK